MKGSVRKRGNSWSYSFDLGFVQGKRKRQEKGGYRTKKDAQNGLREALTEYEQCGNVFKPNEISVHDYFNYWFDAYVLTNCKTSTQDYYRRIIDNHIIPHFKKYKLRMLTSDALQQFLNIKKRNGLSKNSLSNFYGVLSGALKYAVYPAKFIKDNPMSFVTMPKYDLINKGKQNLKIISIRDFERIIERFPFGSNFHIPLHIGFNTGMRGEKGSKQFVLGTPKTPSSYRVIHIGNSLTNLLIKHKEYQDKNRETYGEWYHDSNFIYTKDNGEQITTDSYKYLSRVVNYELGIKFSMHSLRHTHATMLLEQGANIKDIQRRLGHNKLSTTMGTYSHVTDIIRNSTVNIFEKIADKLATSY
ncbi:tyrosine-type recombinase/integrase [Clostridium butyricum]|uniref:tyrosine-type recombinase/integrase n=1 Tax=Clostridium butyricum TaxID=1492 RepID=UPI00374E5DD3